MANTNDEGEKRHEKKCVFLASCTSWSSALDVAVKQKLKETLGNQPLEVLVCSGLASSAGTKSVLEFAVQLNRLHGLHKNERETILSAEDQLLAVQLCLAGLNREAYGEFSVDASKVLVTNDQLNEYTLAETNASQHFTSQDNFPEFHREYRKFLDQNNMTDFTSIYNKLKCRAETNKELHNELFHQHILIFGSPVTSPELAMVKLLSSQREASTVTVELPLDHSFTETSDLSLDEFNVHIEPVTNIIDNLNLISPASSLSNNSVTETYVEKVMMDYVHLLVNSRSELALARVINMPNRELGHKAFTMLKHKSLEKGLSMYQTAASHIMRLRLGGKAYAPDPDCPLMMHVKGLSELTDLIQKLQSVIEEDTNINSAVHRFFSIIKNVIVKSKEGGLRIDSINAVTERLQQRAASLVKHAQSPEFASPVRNASTGGSLVGRQTLRVLKKMLDHQSTLPQVSRSVDLLSDTFSSQATPVRIPCLLSKFRSPIESSPEEEMSKSLYERLNSKQSSKSKGRVPRFVANMDWAQPLHYVGLEKDDQPVLDYYIPSKTVVHAAPRITDDIIKPLSQRILESRCDQENITADAPSLQPAPRENKTNTTKTNRKRGLDLDSSSQPSKKAKRSQPKLNKKTKPLQKGQKQLTAFFRV